MAPHVVILGGGFGGLTAARRLEKLRPPQSARVTLISDVNFMLYTPLLPGAAAGTLEPRHVVVPLREELERTDVRLARVTGADPAARKVFIEGPGGPDSVAYDQLIVALGSTSRTLPIPGLAEHGLGFKTLAEAIALRNRLVWTLEWAEQTDDPELRRQLLTYVFVGAGYAGLEGIAELQDFAGDLVKRYPRSRLEGLRFVLVEAQERVMPEVSPDLAEFACSELRRRGMELRTSTTIERVDETSVTLAGGEVIPTRTMCWTAGVKPVAVVAELGLPLERGRIKADATCRVQGFEDVWAIGDAAWIPDPARKGEPCPPTAQHSMRQGRLVAANVSRALARRPLKKFTYKTKGVFVDMGRNQAVAQTLFLRWRGKPAWFLARTYHLLLMPGTKRRARLMADWTVGLFFGRDASELGQLGHPPRLEETRADAQAAAAQPAGNGRKAGARDRERENVQSP